MCFRWVDDNLEPHEDFVGIQPVQEANAESIATLLKINFVWNVCLSYLIHGGLGSFKYISPKIFPIMT